MDLEEKSHWWKSRGRRELRKLLMDRWDPIGVSGIPEAQDEYDQYLVPLLNLLSDGASTKTIARYLSEVQTGWMELGPATPRDLEEVAVAVVRWYSGEMHP